MKCHGHNIHLCEVSIHGRWCQGRKGNGTRQKKSLNGTDPWEGRRRAGIGLTVNWHGKLWDERWTGVVWERMSIPS